MSGDLKQRLISCLDILEIWAKERGISGWEGAAQIDRARLQRATVTEPAPARPRDSVYCRVSDILDEREDLFLPEDAKEVIERIRGRTQTSLTDEELRSLLQAALPEGWRVQTAIADVECAVSTTDRIVNRIGFPTYAALRKPGGIEACARALRVLAGVEVV